MPTDPENEPRYWIGIASEDHVRKGVNGGFAQLGHGKRGPLERLKMGDWIAYYSPRERMGAGEPVQAFTAIGRIADEHAQQEAVPQAFHPWRRSVTWRKNAQRASIRPILAQLGITKGRENWGILFRRSLLEVDEDDFRIIAGAMKVEIATD